MTTSCCPSYIELVEKHMTEMKPYVSTTGSPMYYAARIAKEKHPDAKIVFVGPCVAKRKEVRRDDAVDYILTFEEVGSILDGMDIQLEQVNSFSILHTSVREAHGFAQAGGVMGAVKAYLREEADKINAIQVSDINKKKYSLAACLCQNRKSSGTVYRSDGLRRWLYHRTEYAQRHCFRTSSISTRAAQAERKL